MRKIFINLGANDGIDILTFKKVKDEEFFQWEIFAFEPLPEAIDLFRKNVKFNNVKLIKKAVGTKDEIRNFYLGEGYASISGSLRSDKTTGMIDPPNTIKKNRTSIKVATIDISKWIKRNISIEDYVILCMDIEGSEYDILNKMILEDTVSLIDELHVEWHSGKLWKLPTEEHNILKSKIEKIFGEKYKEIDPFESYV